MTTSLVHERVNVGRYELVRPLAVGGMALLHVARAVDAAGVARLVVLKQILPQHAANPDFVEMFVDEARVASRLRHRNIVEVLDSGQADGHWFIAMEYLHGRDLRAVMRAARPRGGLSIDAAVAIAVELCAGLDYAHEQRDDEGRPRNIVHRDISPQNVVVTFAGDVKIVDFGIATACDRLTETQNGELKGKLRYMSPEQCRGEATDRRSDIFSTAAVLWELTVGRKLFDGHSELDVMTALTTGLITPPSELVAGFPEELERVLMRGLAADPQQRWSTAREMGEALRAFAAARARACDAAALGALMRSLFVDDLDTVPLALDPHGDSHSAPTRLSSPGAAPSPAAASWPRSWRGSIVAAVALAVVALIAFGRGRRSAPVTHPLTRAPSLSSPSPAAVTKPPPPSPAPSPPTSSVERARHAEHVHHHHAHRARKALSADLDALME